MNNKLFPMIIILFSVSKLWAISFVQAQNALLASGTSQAVSITTTAGNLIVACEGNGTSSTGNTTVTDSASQTWTLIDSTSPTTTAEVSAYYKASSSALTSVTCHYTGTTSNAPCVVAEFSGASATPFDVSVGKANPSSGQTPFPSGSLTTTQANEVLLFCGRASANQTSYTPQGGYTVPATGNNARGWVSYEIVSGVQTATTTFVTPSASTSYANLFMGFINGGSVAPTPQLNDLVLRGAQLRIQGGQVNIK